MERQEGWDQDNPMSVRFKYNPDGYVGGGYGQFSMPHQFSPDTTGIYFDNYEIAHFRLLTDVNYLPYGRAYIEPARKLFKSLGFTECKPFSHYVDDPNSCYMSLKL